MNIVGCNKGLRAGRAVSAVVAWALLLTSCIKEDAGSCGSVGGPDGDVTVGFRSGTFAISGPSGADDGWGTSSTGARSASTRAGVPPTGMVEGAFQIGDLWVDGNRGSTQEKLMTWAEATVYCRSLGLRLPNYEEMESIVSYVVKNSPLPDNAKFEFKPTGTWAQHYYWTSTPRDADASYVWVGYLYPSSAYMDGAPADDNEMVSARCVKREGEEILPPAPDPGPDVENPDGLPVGTTFRVVVYAAGADPQSDSPVDQNTYKIADTKGTIVASAVDEFGNATDDAARELVLRRGAYDFYYFSPAVPASTSMPNPGRYTDLTNGADYMALAHREVIDPSQGPKHYIPEVCFYRMGSYIDVRISPREGEIMGTLEVTGDGLQLWGLPGSGRYEIGDYPYRLITEGSGGMVEFSPADFASEEGAATTVATLGTGGGRAVLPGYARDLQVKVTLTSDGKELKLDASLAGHNFAPGYRYVVELGVGRIADNPELSIDILPWNEYDWGDDSEIGGRPFQTAVVTPEGDIPGTGGTYSVLLEGTVLVEGVTVRASSGGAVLASGRVAALGTPVELTVPANESSEVRSVVFEYQWGDLWLNIGAARSQYPAAFDTGGSATVLEYCATDMYRTYSEAVDYCSSKGEGWRLPTQNEMMYYWCVAPACDSDLIDWMSDYGEADYWTTTMYEGRQQQFDMTLGTYVWKSSSIFARCVKDRTDSKKRYPYVTTASDGGVVVVLRDDEGGLDPAALFPERVTESRTGDVSSEDNRMAAKFRVQRAQLEAIMATEITQGNAVTYCNDLVAEGYSDWRLPSQREMTMLYVLGCSESVDFGQQNASGVGPETVQPIGSPYLYQQPGFTQFAHSVVSDSADPYTDYYAIANATGSSTKFWMMAPIYGYVHQLLKPSGQRQRFWFRCVRDEDGSAPAYTVSEASVTPAGDIPAEGKAVSLTLTGDLPSAGVEVRAQSGGTALVTGKVTASGTAVSLAVPANRSFDSRTVTFEYNLNGMWTPTGDSRSQAGYSVSNATHTALATIPGPGATYSVTLTGFLPADGVQVRAQSGGTALVTGKVTASGTAVSLTVPANASYSSRTVTFEYLWNGTWTKIGDARSQAGYSVSNATHTAPATIPGPGATYSVTLTGHLPSSVAVRAQSGGTALVSGTVTKSGTAVSLAVPANASFSSRTVTFEYQWNGTWTKIGDARTQQGYNVTAATHAAPATIPGPGASYSVTLTGHLPSGVSIRAQSGNTTLVSGTVTRSGTAVSLAVPGNQSYNSRTVTFQYNWNGTWTKIGADRTQQGYNVTKATVSSSGNIPRSGGTYTVTLTGWGGYQIRAVSGSTQLVINTNAPGNSVNYSASLTVPIHTSPTDHRNVTFQYLFNGTWKNIETRTQTIYVAHVNDLYMHIDQCSTRCGGNFWHLSEVGQIAWKTIEGLSLAEPWDMPIGSGYVFFNSADDKYIIRLTEGSPTTRVASGQTFTYKRNGQTFSAFTHYTTWWNYESLSNPDGSGKNHSAYYAVCLCKGEIPAWE